MCLAIPARVVALPAPDVARIDLAGVRKEISLALRRRRRDRRLRHRPRRLRADEARPGGGRAHARHCSPKPACCRPRGSRAMKYIDEFRDGALARKLAAAIAREARPGRTLQPHGVLRRPHPRDLALRPRRPAAGQRAHDPRPRLPGVRAADRAHRQRDRARARPGLILCTYADTLRVPASKGLSLLKAKARGADIRMVYSAPTRCASRRRTRSARSCSSPSASRPPRRRRRSRSGRRSALGLTNFSVFCNHVLTPVGDRATSWSRRRCASSAPCRSTASSARRTCRR